MKLLKIILFIVAIVFLVHGLGFAQPPQVDKATTPKTKKTEIHRTYINPEFQKEIKELDDAMKNYEDAYREYNRLAGLKGRIYRDLLKFDKVVFDSLDRDPLFRQDSIITILRK